MLKKLICLCFAACLCLLAAFPACAAFDVAQTGLTFSGEAQQLGKPKDYGSSKVTLSVPNDRPAEDGINPITGEYWTGEYDLSKHPQWKGKITEIRFDPFNSPGMMNIDYIKLQGK